MMASRLNPRESGVFVTARAKHVQIKDDCVTKLAELIADAAEAGKLSADAFKFNSIFPLSANLSLKQLMNWTFMVDAINFNFWTLDSQPKYVVSHKKETRAGYLGMVTAVNRAIDEGKPMCDPSYYGALSLEDLKHIFRSKTSSSLPLFEERVRVMHSIATTLKEKYEGCFSNVVKKAEGDALKLVDIITEDFEPFRDYAVYEGHSISLLKRAQIVAADLDLLLSLKNQPTLKNIDQLTMFADYRVPQVLLFYGVLEYSKELMEKLQREHLFENGSLEEVEIRACSIEAVERLVCSSRKELEKRSMSPDRAKNLVNSIKVDFFLWDYRVQHAKELASVPYHRTRCIYY